jgi:hypothetical protein
MYGGKCTIFPTGLKITTIFYKSHTVLQAAVVTGMPSILPHENST